MREEGNRQKGKERHTGSERRRDRYKLTEREKSNKQTDSIRVRGKDKRTAAG